MAKEKLPREEVGSEGEQVGTNVLLQSPEAAGDALSAHGAGAETTAAPGEPKVVDALPKPPAPFNRNSLMSPESRAAWKAAVAAINNAARENASE